MTTPVSVPASVPSPLSWPSAPLISGFSPLKRKATDSRPQTNTTTLGKLVKDAVTHLKSSSCFTSFARSLRPRSEFSTLHNIVHPARRLLSHYSLHGAPVRIHSSPWSPSRIQQAAIRGSHRSCQEFLDFLSEEMVDFINKRFWTVLPYSSVKQLPHLRIAPFGVVPQHSRRPCIICDVS